jgi:hypothetical protein
MGNEANICKQLSVVSHHIAASALRLVAYAKSPTQRDHFSGSI